MYTGLVYFIFALAGCYAETSTAVPPRVLCGKPLDTIYACLGNPKIISTEPVVQCIQHSSECERMTCIFGKLSWLDGEKVNKTRVSEYLDQYAVQHPSWSAAATHSKATCVNPEHNLPVQGVYLNCPAYDVMHCFLTSFIRNATPSQWKTTASCQDPRAYAASCPVCPPDCFAVQIPYGSCNACLSFPKAD